MKPAPFEYFDPDSLDEVLTYLRQYGDEARILAGGQSLGPVLNMRLAVPEVIVDLNRVVELDYQLEEDGFTRVGALTRQSSLEDSQRFGRQQPLIAAAIPYVGHRAIRNRGTVGGSLAHADPAAEWPMLAVMLSAEMVVQSATRGHSVLAAETFFEGLLTTALAADELLVEVRIPPWPADAGWAFIEFSRRHGDFALAGVGVRLSVDERGCCSDVRLGLFGVHPTPIRARGAEAMLQGELISDALLAEVAHQAGQEIEPDGDIHASAAYRRHLTVTLMERALTQAVARAAGGEQHG